MLKTASAVIVSLFLAFVAFGATSFAAGAAQPEDGSLLDLTRPVYDAVMHGQWWIAAAGALVLVAAAARKYLAPRYAWARSSAGSALIVLVGSFGGAALTALAAAGPGAVLSAALAWTAFKIALAAAGGYGLIKALIVDPYLKPWADKAPAWLQPALAVLVWAFDHIPAGSAARPASVDHRTGDHAAFTTTPPAPAARREGAGTSPATPAVKSTAPDGTKVRDHRDGA